MADFRAKYAIGQVVNHSAWEGHPPVPVRITKVHDELSLLGNVLYEVFPDKGVVVEFRLAPLSVLEATGTDNALLPVGEIETEDCTVKFKNDAETQTKAFERLLDFFVKYHAFSGESVMQNDDPQVFAPVVLSELADDVFQFDVEWK